MPLDSFRLEPDATATGNKKMRKKGRIASVSTLTVRRLNLLGTQLYRYAPGLAGSLRHLLLDTLQNILLPLLLNIGLLRWRYLAIPHSAISPAAVQKGPQHGGQ